MRLSTVEGKQGLACGALEGAVAVPVLFFVGGDAFGEGVSMDSEHHRGFREVLFVPGEGLLYIELLKLADGFVEEDMSFQHLVDQGFETVVNQSSFPVSSL